MAAKKRQREDIAENEYSPNTSSKDYSYISIMKLRTAIFTILCFVLLLADGCREPNFNYTVSVPEGWTKHDTVLQNLKIRLMYGPDSLANDRPAVNILVSSMNGEDFDVFVYNNMMQLKNGNAQRIIIIGQKGDMDIPGIHAKFFTYYMEQGDSKRDMINYIIPLNGFAYMITCGTNAGTMHKYRTLFDNIALSFKG